jgi:hypothetical protein
MCMIRYRPSNICRHQYLVAEEDELRKDGKGLEVLSERPGEVSNERSIERGMEEQGQNCSQSDEVVALDGVEVSVVAGPKNDHDVVKHVA